MWEYRSIHMRSGMLLQPLSRNSIQRTQGLFVRFYRTPRSNSRTESTIRQQMLRRPRSTPSMLAGNGSGRHPSARGLECSALPVWLGVLSDCLTNTTLQNVRFTPESRRPQCGDHLRSRTPTEHLARGLNSECSGTFQRSRAANCCGETAPPSSGKLITIRS